MSTETIDPRYADLDAWPIGQVIRSLWEGQVEAASAVEKALAQIEAAVGGAAEALKASGRLIYAGAGTSGRIAVQDGAELLPTFGWPKDRMLFALAGGNRALIEAVENAEDDAADGAAQMDIASACACDVVIGVTASGTTPFTLAAIEQARRCGALTIGLACNQGTSILSAAQYPVLLDTGSEVLAGSTRLKAGTAQKIALNLISTGVMVRLGRVYKGRMVDMRATNAKLRKRSEIMVAELAGCSLADAAAALTVSGGEIKPAILVASGTTLTNALERLATSGGNLRAALIDD